MDTHTKIDQRQEGSDDRRYKNGVERNVPSRGDDLEPAGEWDACDYNVSTKQVGVHSLSSGSVEHQMTKTYRTSIACKRPQLPRGSSNLSDTSRKQDDDDDQGDQGGTSVALRRVEKHLDHRLTSRAVQDAVEITKTEDVCYPD